MPPHKTGFLSPIHQAEAPEHGDFIAVVKQMAEKFQPERIILFGSYAYGKPKPESDLDLLVVMEYAQ